MLKRTALFSILFASFFVGTLPAHADAVLMFDRETTGSLRPVFRRGADADAPPVTPQATKQAVTVLFQGANARVEFRTAGAAPESAPVSVLIYDGMAQTVTTLDPAKKTFFTQKYKEVIDGERPARERKHDANGANNDAPPQVPTPSGTVAVTASRENSAYIEKQIGDATHRKHAVTGKIEMPRGNQMRGKNNDAATTTDRIIRVSRDASGVIRQRGGSADGRVLVPANSPAVNNSPPSLSVSGDVWYTDGGELFTAGRDTPVAAIYRLMLPDNAGFFGAAFTKSLVSALKNRKGLPGESILSLKMNLPFANRQGAGDAANPAHDAVTKLTLTKADTKTAAPHDAALFAVPIDFTKAEPPAPEFGRGGFNGRRGEGNDTQGNVPNE